MEVEFRLMSRPMLKNLRDATVCVLMCVASAHSVLAQQTRGATAGSSSWQAGTVKVTAPAATSGVIGGSSSWTAGKGSIPLGAQAGGVWRDGSTFSVTTSKPAPSGAATGLEPVGIPSAFARLSSASKPGGGGTISRGGQTPKTFALHSSLGSHGLSGTRSGIGSRSQMGVRRASGSKGTTGTRRNPGFSHGGSKSTGTSSGLTSPLKGESGMQSLTPGSSLETAPRTLNSQLEQSTH